MTEKEKIILIDVALRILNIQISEYSLIRVLRVIELLEKNDNPTIKDVLKLNENE